MNQKIENLLNFALESNVEEIEKTPLLNAGYDKQQNTWELIVRYIGRIDFLNEYEGVKLEILFDNYAIITAREELIDEIASLPQIIYVEKPRDFYNAELTPKRVSCISGVQGIEAEYIAPPDGLFGKGVIMAFIDSGIDYTNALFRNDDGTTKILEMWDQTDDRVYSQSQINEALVSNNPSLIVPERDFSGHGTHVTGIAASIATKSNLLIVKLKKNETVNLMRGIDYVIRRAIHFQMPVSVNISIGSTYGSHDGTSLLSTYINSVSDNTKAVIVIGSGNEGATAGHYEGNLRTGRNETVEIAVSDFESSLNIQLWKNYVDIFDVYIESPSGIRQGPVQRDLVIQRYYFEPGMEAAVMYGEPKPYSQYQEIIINLVSGNQFISSGIWKIELVPVRIVDGRYDMWLPSEATLNLQTKFLNPSPYVTLTIPSAAAKVISVGAYNSASLTYADFSGRGYTRLTNQVKPDIVAPGVDIISANTIGGFESRSGTSMATPFVTASAALLMEWGIVRENDPYLYGEKVKAYLIRGARKLPGFSEYPNRQVGWGALCVKDSLPL
ncbi:MAG: S8 family peptidase [Eubacterium sp.]